MKLVNDINEPELVGLVTDVDDLIQTKKIVDNLNKDLIDSGFDQYQFETVIEGNKIYIKKK